MFCICKENNKADSILPDIVRNIISRCILFSNQPNSLIMFIEKENIFTSNNFVCISNIASYLFNPKTQKLEKMCSLSYIFNFSHISMLCAYIT